MSKQKRILSLFLSVVCLVLTAAMAFTLSACNKNETPEPEDAVQGEKTDVIDIGEGATAFTFRASFDGEEKTYNVKTDKATVGEALQEAGLIEGEEGQYGLYVTKVCGVEAVYESDGTYWAFYIDGDYAMNGVDQTQIEAGVTYSLVKEKG